MQIFANVSLFQGEPIEEWGEGMDMEYRLMKPDRRDAVPVFFLPPPATTRLQDVDWRETDSRTDKLTYR
jgi:hypothetical protein